MAELRFSLDPGADIGFDASTVSRESVSDENVVRELVQNSLDAADRGTECLNMSFKYSRVQLSDIPHISEYEKAFKAAETFRKKRGGSGPTGKAAAQRIRRILDRRKVPVPCLVCFDDGKGIDPRAIRSLYGEGATNKPHQGRGSVGKGHLTAFSPSDLRYVLYAGRHQPIPPTDRTSTFGAHAVLATHRNHKGTEQYSPHGYVMPYEQPGQRSLFVSDAEGVETFPSMIEGHMPAEGRTGSVVVITGYRPLSKPNAKPDAIRDDIFTFVAKNFTVALHQRTLKVGYESREAGCEGTLDKDSAPEFLKRVAAQKNRTRGSVGPAGQHASRVWDALDAPDVKLEAKELADEEEMLTGEDSERNTAAEQIDWSGVTVWFRKRKPTEDRSCRVFVFREGMWITDTECPHLKPGDVGGCNPFDAVVNFKQKPGQVRLADLLRKAEGASHARVLTREITDSEERKRLTGALKRLRTILRGRAGDLDSEQLVPAKLRFFNANREYKLTERAKPKHRQQPTDTVLTPGAAGGETEERNSRGEKKPNTRPRQRPKGPAAPRPGKANDTRTVIVPALALDGQAAVRQFNATWNTRGGGVWCSRAGGTQNRAPFRFGRNIRLQSAAALAADRQDRNRRRYRPFSEGAARHLGAVA